jgi:hypothetical protein
MSKSDAFEANWLDLVFLGTAIPNIADNAATAPLTNLQVGLHTADPGEAGNQTTSEATYTGYARVAVARNGTGWTRTGNSVSPVATVNFPACTGGTNTITHFSVGTAASGTGKVLYSGTYTPNQAVATGVTPQLATASTITED